MTGRRSWGVLRATASGAGFAIFAVVLAAGCGGDRVAPARSEGGVVTRIDGGSDAKTLSPPPTSLPPAAPDSSDALPAVEPSETEANLRGEDAEGNPRSESVTLKLTITPAARGTVHWGRKKLADLQPGKMTIELERPRSSGPLDLLIRAEGFLPHHVRLFTDRNDKLSVRLVHTNDAHSLFGYRKGPVPAAP